MPKLHQTAAQHQFCLPPGLGKSHAHVHTNLMNLLSAGLHIVTVIAANVSNHTLP